MDNAGNISDASVSDRFVVDRDTPSVPDGIAVTVSGSPYDGSTWTSGDVKLVAYGSTALSGIDYYECSIDGGTVWTKMEDQSSVTDSISGQCINDTHTVSIDMSGRVLVHAVSNSGIKGSTASVP